MDKKLLFLIGLVVAGIIFPAQAIDPIRVAGNKFMTTGGKEVVFRGLCFSDPHKLERDGHWDASYFTEAKNWGANIVRFVVHPTALRERGWDDYFVLLDRGVALAKEAGLYVIMDWHSIGNLKEEKFTNPMYITTKEETFRFWKEVARRYKNEPVVALYELFNEPTVTGSELGTCTWDEWAGLMEQLIDTIREENPTAVCLVAGFNWAYSLVEVGERAITRENIAYVSHPYPQKRPEPWEVQWDVDFGFVATKYPVICTEVGYCLADEKGTHIPVISGNHYGEHLTAYFEDRGISFTVWCFDPQYAPMLFSDWEYTPTTQGRFFKNYLQRVSQ